MFLNTLLPLMRGLSSLDVKISADGAGLRIAVIPVLGDVKQETQDAVLATLQAGLSRPFVFTASATDDLDQIACDAMRGLAAARSPALDALGDYRAAVEAATESARKAAADKAKAPKTAVPSAAKSPTPPSKPTPPPSAADADAVAEQSDAVAAAAQVSRGASLAADLFA